MIKVLGLYLCGLQVSTYHVKDLITKVNTYVYVGEGTYTLR
jgi:hypothetical protein